MKVNFKYNKDKDIWCLMNYGKGSFNSKQPTKVYEKMVEEFGENIDENKTSNFIENYLKNNSISIEKFIKEYQDDWNSIDNIYYKKAEEIFGVSLKNDVDIYLSINNRSPYSMKENWFFVSLPAYSMRKTAMHELWHFYTWYRFGNEWELLSQTMTRNCTRLQTSYNCSELNTKNTQKQTTTIKPLWHKYYLLHAEQNRYLQVLKRMKKEILSTT